MVAIKEGNSLLAREINWLETESVSRHFDQQLDSLLAREINWLETNNSQDNIDFELLGVSLLAREINWLETWGF